MGIIHAVNFWVYETLEKEKKEVSSGANVSKNGCELHVVGIASKPINLKAVRMQTEPALS